MHRPQHSPSSPSTMVEIDIGESHEPEENGSALPSSAVFRDGHGSKKHRHRRKHLQSSNGHGGTIPAYRGAAILLLTLGIAGWIGSVYYVVQNQHELERQLYQSEATVRQLKSDLETEAEAEKALKAESARNGEALRTELARLVEQVKNAEEHGEKLQRDLKQSQEMLQNEVKEAQKKANQAVEGAKAVRIRERGLSQYKEAIVSWIKDVDAEDGDTLMTDDSKLQQKRRRREKWPLPPVSDPDKPIVIMHIAKNGGTSANSLLSNLSRKVVHRKYVNKRQPGNQDHYDWSYIETKVGNPHPVLGTAEVFTTLREPVARAISHFYFTKHSSWVKNSPYAHQNLTEYLADYQTMLDTRDVWQDGQAAVSWLTGTHIGGWVGCKAEWVEEREKRAQNIEEMLTLSADRLDQTVWFGLVEEPDKSMELLGHVLGMEEPPKFPKSNVGSTRKKEERQKPTEHDLAVIRSLVPQDIWLYEYAKKLFEARYDHYKTEQPYVHPDRPPMPDPDCVSTRFHISCKGGPLAPLEYEYKT